MTLGKMREMGDHDGYAFDVFVGLVMLAALIVIVLTVRRWDD
jgi:hypothetical protein